jgi:lysophospholipase L1-like esterase
MSPSRSDIARFALFAVLCATPVGTLLHRDREPANPQMSSTGRVRIAALGDSTTAGTPAFQSPLESPPAGRGDVTSQYAYWLIQAHPEWEVLNKGVNGERSDQIRARFERDVIAEKPAIVIIIAGVNDVYQERPAAHVIEQLQWMYRRAAQAGIRVIAGTIIPYNTATPEQNGTMREINSWIQRQAVSGVLGYVDTRAAVAAPGNPDRLSETADQLHPSPSGYRAMADAIRPVIEQILH